MSGRCSGGIVLSLPRDYKGLEDRALELAGELSSIPSGERVLVVSHLDADGISSGSIIAAALIRAGASPHVRIVKQLDEGALKEVSQVKAKYIVFTDMGSGQRDLLKGFGSEDTKLFIVDHHQLPSVELAFPQKENSSAGRLFELNPHIFGFDGSSELSASGTAFLVAKKMSSENSSLAPLAVVGALGDMQDKGEQGSLIGLNASIAEEAQKRGQLTMKKGLKLYGFESRPLVKCLEYTLNPFLPGLSGDEGACFKFLKNIGIEPRKPDGSWRSISDLSPEELRTVTNGLIKYLISQGAQGRDAESVIGVVYTINSEGADSPLRDAREYASSINACGRLGRHGLGVALCLGDRAEALAELRELLSEYRRTISGYLRWLEGSKESIKIMRSVQAILAGNNIDDRMIGTIVSIAFSMKPFTRSKPILGLATSEGAVKISARGTQELVRRGLNLGAAVRDASERVGGAGGGHNIAAGGQIPVGKEDEFLSIVDAIVERMIGGVRL
ncbi:MAG: DHH family phosphoesterase [Candidatus Verstraetearchaeota archaeon]|nr:DHH family phosphoesterase [Candidatus Verstraetearchaeota archaeon]